MDGHAVSSAGPDQLDHSTSASMVPFQLVDLVKPGPSGTVASTAALATAAHSAIVTAAPDVAPAGLLATVAARASPCRNVSTVMQDLLQAAEKALASGLGDWHLQSIQDISPEFQQHVLIGALGPEALKHKHRVPEPQILHIYGLLHRYCTGFQQEVEAAVAGAEHREQLLASIWTAFAQLWDECVQVSFQGEVLAAIDELQGTYATLLDTQDVLAAVQQENSTLKERCSEFVRANLDHMLAWRTLKAKADALEAEVAMLSSANSEISLRAAAINARNTQLTVQLEGLGARLSGAEQQLQDREGALAAARAAMLEKDSGLRQLEAQVAALGQQLVGAQQDSKKQDSCISDLERQLQCKDQLVQDAERRVADKQRAFNLLHADFVKQKADAAEAIEATTKLQQQLHALQQEATKAHTWQRRWEACRLEVEDLAAANTRAMMRRHELVASYWPVMSRLNQAEDAVAALISQVIGLGQQPAVQLPPRDTRAKEVEGLESCDDSSAGTCSNTGSHQQHQQGAASSSSSPDPQEPAVSAQQLQQHPQPQGQQVQHQAGNGLPDQAAATALQGVHEALQEELQQLRSSYLLLQEEYWRQKERLMALDCDAVQLKAAAETAIAAAGQAAAELAVAQQQAARDANARERLEADLTGCRSWIRELERTEQQYLKTIREQGSLEQAAVSAQRQADDLRSRLAEAQSSRQLAQAAADAAAQERTQLLQHVAQELNRASLVEQALQQVFRQEVSSGRARQSQLQDALHQRLTEVEAARAQLAAVQKEQAAAAAERQGLRLQLQDAQRANVELQQRLDKAQGVLLSAVQRLESLEARVSLVNSSSLTGASGMVAERPLDVAVEAALHLLERLLVSMQCLAADAATISNASAASKVEVLIRGIMQGLEAAAGVQAQQQLAVGSGPGSSLVVLRNAAGAAGKQRCQELERQLSALQLQLSDTSSQLVAAVSANARLQRMLNLKSRAAASLEQQLASAEAQVQRLQASHTCSEGSLMQLQEELASVRLQNARLAGESNARVGALQAAHSRAETAEAAVEQLQAAAAAAGASTVQLTEQLQQALDASRRDVLAATASHVQQAAAALQVEQLQQQLDTASAQLAAQEREVRECRHKADICLQSARDAEYRAVEATTLLADARRELESSQHLLNQQQLKQQKEQQTRQ